jgi:membrane-associated phospholipid phosphatase
VGVLLGILAILVGVSRVMARVHYPVDIVGSVAFATFAAYISWIILRRLNRG